MAENLLVNMIANKKILLAIILLCNFAQGWIHNLKLQTDNRRDILLTHAFGFLKAGTLTVNVTLFSYKGKDPDKVNSYTFGFTLDKSKSPGLGSYVENLQKCALNDSDKFSNIVFFRFDLSNNTIIVERRGQDFKELNIVDEKALLQENLYKQPAEAESKTIAPVNAEAITKAPNTQKAIETTTEVKNSRRRREVETNKKENDDESKAQVIRLPLKSVVGEFNYYQTFFQVNIDKEAEEGLYNFYFHNCMKESSLVNLTIQIIQKNEFGYLSADEMPIPILYFVSCVIFFVLSIVWFVVLRRADGGVYKIHYLMLVVIFFKSISNLFHGVNMHMIEKTGIHLDAWAILWYIVYLMRGAVLFVTVLLIGAGWAFIKHVFTDREKKLFLVVIPLQILMNVAWVIVEESEEGYSSYDTWHKIFMGVDLLCCFAILFPVIWSIRHLQEASKTDGKAAINLNKLKLFRHFYIMVVAYIYFTRIIGYLLVITLPFRYGWMKDLFEEAFLLVFFTLTGYKFRPTSDNPYLQVPLDSDDEEEIELDEVLTKSGSTESVVRVNQGRVESHNNTIISRQIESSHEFD
uniref:GOST seven transmembrane domain-containing protein n=1 Tax=Biomphalaria glabrata TaxID=6526 RepID=A0A2C9JIT0_BIOGL